jgi:uncharacterized protein (DUF2345 family)
MMTGDEQSGARPYAEAGRAFAEEGLVLLEGPNGIAVAMTADAAMGTGESLIAAAREARNQTPRGGQ